MQNVISIWEGLDARRRVIIVLATVAVFAAVLLMSRMVSQPNMTLLYAGLEGNAAGEVVQRLDQAGVQYEVRGGAIYVPSSRRDELRMTLASDGLPASGGAGYELLDTLSGFGTTSQMFDAAYWRAKEGELARTIVASPLVRTARVHISNPGQQVFQRGQNTSASVFVTPANGGISAPQAKAFSFLVASAVTGLTADNVSVIDGSTGRVISTEDASGAPLTSGFDRAGELKEKVERLLARHVGTGNAIVEVSVETETVREEKTERRIDPESRVAISTDTEERSNNSKGSANANVTVASNLPDGDANEGGQGTSSQNSETRERANYDVSATEIQTVKMPGDIKRLSVAVLVDGVRSTGADGQPVWSARSDEDMANLRELVSSAVGYDEARGDIITLKSLEFQPEVPAGTSASPSLLQSLNLDLTSLIQMVVLAVVVLAISLFVVRPILSRPVLAENAIAGALPGPDGEGGDALTGEISDGAGALPDLTSGDFDFDLGDAGMPEFGSLDSTPEDPVERLKQLIEDRQSETVEVLRGWMEDEKEKV